MTAASGSRASGKLDWEDLDPYRFFALVFASPSPERFDTLAQPALKDLLNPNNGSSHPLFLPKQMKI